MANPAFVQGKGGGTSSAANPTNFSFTSAVTSGNTIVVFVAISNALSVSSITDSAGNIYTNRYTITDTPDGFIIYVFDSIGVTGGSLTIHINLSGTGFSITFAAQEFSNISNVDVSNNALSTTSTSPQSLPAVTTLAANDMVVGMLGVSTSTTLTLGTGYTNLTKSTVEVFQLGMESQLDTGVGLITPTMGSSAGAGWNYAAVTIAYLGPATAGLPPGKLFGTETSPSTTTLQAVNRASRY